MREGRDPQRGVNAEQEWVEVFRSLKPFDGNFDLEHYERIAVRTRGDEAEVTVHGQELYLWREAGGRVSASGGEFKLNLFLGKREDRWTVIRTDDVTLAEWHLK